MNSRLPLSLEGGAQAGHVFGQPWRKIGHRHFRKLAESKTLELRLETFNALNRAQFFGGSAVDGNISGATFGYVTQAAPPRVAQVAVKFNFLAERSADQWTTSRRLRIRKGNKPLTPQ